MFPWAMKVCSEVPDVNKQINLVNISGVFPDHDSGQQFRLKSYPDVVAPTTKQRHMVK